MSTAFQVKPKPIEATSNSKFAGPYENALENHDEDSALTLKVVSLMQGIIKTRANPAKAPYTILLVGETGVGKSSLLELIANVLHGKDADHYDFDTLDHTNERGGSSTQSQTNAARLYEFTSKNGVVVRILDTPGLADTRGAQQDEIHMKSITDQIKKHIDSVTAVLVLANGTVPRITVGTDYALSTLSAMFPKTLAKNISFMFTNVASPLHWNICGDAIPDVLKDAPQFCLNNPIALHRKYVTLKDNPNTRKVRADYRKAVKASEQDALEMLVEFFDWLGGLEQQPATEIVPLYEKLQNNPALTVNTPTPMHQMPSKRGKESHRTGHEPEAQMLELGHISTEVQEVGQEGLGIIQGRFQQIKETLELLRKAKEFVHEGVQRVKQIFIGE